MYRVGQKSCTSHYSDKGSRTTQSHISYNSASLTDKIFSHLTALTQSKSLFLARNAANNGDRPDTEMTAKLDRFLLNLLSKFSRRRKN